MKKLAAFELVLLGYIGIITTVILACHPEGTPVYLAYHVSAVALILLLVFAQGRYGGRFWTFCRYWYVLLLCAAAFRELHFLVPQVHPFDDNRFDHFLNALDRRWFGDVDGFFLSGWPPLYIDLLHLCYWFYFVSPLVPGGVLFARGDWPRLREYLTVVLTGLFLSYLGYLLVPAIGPHHFYQPRPAQLDGWLLGRSLHQAIIAAEWRMPDAFPSGHALLSLIIIAMTWRLHRPSFRVLVAPAAGCILATMALRYHYVVDVVASVAIFPGAVAAGIGLNRWWENRGGVPESPEP